MRFTLALLVAFVATAGVARAQTLPSPWASAGQAQPAPVQAAPGQPIKLPATICGLEVPAPENNGKPAPPPAGSPTISYALLPCFEKQGGVAVVDPETYLYYMELKNYVSSASNNRWVPWTDQIEQVVLGDFKRLWATTFLDDLSIEVIDVDLGNGVPGKLVVYNMEERQRVKIVDYVATDAEKVDQGKIEEELKKRGIKMGIDTFIDPGSIRRVTGVVREV